MTARSQNAACLRAHMQAETNHDLEGTLATVHPDAFFEDMPVRLSLRSRSEVQRHYSLWWNAFKIQTDQGTLHWIDDDFLIGDSHFIGRHVGRFLGVEATGRAVRFPFVVFVRFRDGLISGERFVYDLSNLLSQIGGAPEIALS